MNSGVSDPALETPGNLLEIRLADLLRHSGDNDDYLPIYVTVKAAPVYWNILDVIVVQIVN